MARDREDFRADYGDGSEPEKELDDFEQSHVPEDDDDETEGTHDELQALRDGMQAEIDQIYDEIQALTERALNLEDEVEIVERRIQALGDE